MTAAMVRIDRILADTCEKSVETSAWKTRACLAEERIFRQIMKTKVSTAYIVYGKSDDRPRDAVNGNLSEAQDFVTYSMRRLYLSSPNERRRTLFHEFATLADLKTSDAYGYSTLILDFLKDNEELKGLLVTLPVQEMEQKTFRLGETSIESGGKHFAVLLQNAADYENFCIAKGFSHVVNESLSGSSFSSWCRETGFADGMVLINSDGEISTHVFSSGTNKSRVIASVTCR